MSTSLITVSSTVTRQILIVAQGDFATTSYPGEDGGEYSENITGSSIPIVDVQDVQSLNRGIGRSVDEQNAMCGLVGPFNVVYPLGPCNLSDPGPGFKP
jgi:hypothetical protein